jgi:intein/homing endonuclease
MKFKNLGEINPFIRFVVFAFVLVIGFVAVINSEWEKREAAKAARMEKIEELRIIREAAMERIEMERIEMERIKMERIKYAYRYTSECRTNKECWMNALNSLKKAIEEDLRDGIIDEDWKGVRFGILDNINKIGDGNLRATLYIQLSDIYYF